ncbi:MAG: DnaD domain protein [Firmicutes bacterium]|nr:DnaD domain protein [Bacillota bacterium]
MRLHNRQIKATFWNDPDLLQWPREKRWFYEGLSQLADDSGCLENSPFAFKLHLFPSPLDADITVELISHWVNELIEQGKLIPYDAGGKKCLFLVNFHKHQALRSPAAPEVPLPPWVTFTPTDKRRRSGTYTVRNPYDFLTDTVRISYGLQPEPEPEIEPEPELDHDDDDNARARAKANFVQTYEQEFGRLISPTDLQQLESYVADGMEEEVVCEAIRRARAQNVLKLSYVRSILNAWKAEGVLTMAGVARADIEYENRKARDGPKGGKRRGEPKQYPAVPNPESAWFKKPKPRSSPTPAPDL